MTNHSDRDEYATPDNDENEEALELEGDPTDEELEEIENDNGTSDDDDDDDVTIEETSTPFASDHSTQNAATSEDAAASANNTTVPAQAAEKKESAYRKRLNEKGLDAFPLEAPRELIDMLRVAAEKAGGLALAALTRQLICDYVNAQSLTHEDAATGQQVPWTFDKSRLDETRSRTSTRGMTEEQKAARVEKAKQNAKAERELVKQLLAAHRAKLKGGDPNAKALEATLSSEGN